MDIYLVATIWKFITHDVYGVVVEHLWQQSKYILRLEKRMAQRDAFTFIGVDPKPRILIELSEQHYPIIVSTRVHYAAKELQRVKPPVYTTTLRKI